MRLLCALLLAWSATALAHRPSDAFLTLEVNGTTITGQWEVALRDLEVLSALDMNGDRQLTWGELRAEQPALQAQLASALHLFGDGKACGLSFTDLLIHDRSDGRYAWFALVADCAAAPRALTLDYRLLFNVDPTHRGILVLRSGDQAHSAVFAPDAASRTFTLAEPSARAVFIDYLREGAWHIWIGLDHILFLLVLLLPAVLVYEHGRWQARDHLGAAVWDVAAVVTAFTLAHSITLTLAALDMARLPSRWVEASIAATVLLAALNNLRPVVRARWALAFGLGLIHGFGFASVLGDLGLPQGPRLTALVAFNLGVELGQLAILAVFVPLAFAVRRTPLYRVGVRVLGSIAVALLAGAWLLERLGLIGT